MTIGKINFHDRCSFFVPRSSFLVARSSKAIVDAKSNQDLHNLPVPPHCQGVE